MLTLVICHGCLLDALAFCMLCHQLPRILYLWKLGHLAAVRVGEQEGSMKGGNRVQVQRVPAAAGNGEDQEGQQLGASITTRDDLL